MFKHFALPLPEHNVRNENVCFFLAEKKRNESSPKLYSYIYYLNVFILCQRRNPDDEGNYEAIQVLQEYSPMTHAYHEYAPLTNTPTQDDADFYLSRNPFIANTALVALVDLV